MPQNVLSAMIITIKMAVYVFNALYPATTVPASHYVHPAKLGTTLMELHANPAKLVASHVPVPQFASPVILPTCY